MLPNLKIGNLTAKYPIIQGGMGVGISLSSLAGAVAKAGGIGVISAAQPGWRDPEFYPDTFYDFKVIGAGTDNEDPENGDIKWVPVYWSTSANPNSNRIRSTWKIGSKEGIDQEGTFNLYVFFRKYTCKDSKWQSTDKIQSVQYKFQSAPLSEK